MVKEKRIAALFCNNPQQIDSVYGSGRKEILAKQVKLYPHIITKDNIEEHLPQIKNIELIFSTWGMFVPTDEQFDQLPNLQAVFYAAGSVKRFAKPFLDRKIKVISSWAANAIPVAEFTLAQILLSCKRYFLNQLGSKDLKLRKERLVPRGLGIFDEKVALIGLGMIGKKVIELLQPFKLDVLVVDPYIEQSVADEFGFKLVDLDYAFKKAYVVSNHLPNIPSTVGLLNGKLFTQMREGATFINTGRGAQVAEDEFIEVLKKRPDLTALLDVTMPEPPEEGSEFYSLPNVFLSSHIAGSSGNEVVRMADFMLEEFEKFNTGKPLNYEITFEMLETMA